MTEILAQTHMGFKIVVNPYLEPNQWFLIQDGSKLLIPGMWVMPWITSKLNGTRLPRKLKKSIKKRLNEIWHT